MSLPDIAGILSRYFVLGFFLPVFFTLMIVTQAVSAGFPLPNVYERHSEGARVLILGGVALLLGLLLSGFRYFIDSAFAGAYFVPRPGSRLSRILGPWTRLVLLFQTQTFRRYLEDRDSDRHPKRRQSAAWHLDRRFPQWESRLLPTSYGNTLRATADYAWSRWGLDLEAVEKHITLLMSDGERDQHTDARTDLAFFRNATLGTLAILAVLVADEITHGALDWKPAVSLYIVVFLIAAAMYGQTVSALDRLGRLKRASIDLHRRELYGKLGLRAPADFREDRDMARAVNRCLLWGAPVPDYLAAAAPDDGS